MQFLYSLNICTGLVQAVLFTRRRLGLPVEHPVRCTGSVDHFRAYNRRRLGDILRMHGMVWQAARTFCTDQQLQVD